jgi:hypothetical protein
MEFHGIVIMKKSEFSESSESCTPKKDCCSDGKHRCFYVRHDHHKHDFRVLTATAARRTKCLH